MKSLRKLVLKTVTVAVLLFCWVNVWAAEPDASQSKGTTSKESIPLAQTVPVVVTPPTAVATPPSPNSADNQYITLGIAAIWLDNVAQVVPAPMLRIFLFPKPHKMERVEAFSTKNNGIITEKQVLA